MGPWHCPGVLLALLLIAGSNTNSSFQEGLRLFPSAAEMERETTAGLED